MSPHGELPRTTAQWHRRVWGLAWPIILSNMTVPLVGAVDTAVVGRLDDASYMGAVAIGAIIFNFIYWSFGFLRMGTTGFVAQALGAGDNQELAASMARAVLLALVIALILLAAQLPIRAAAFALMEAGPRVEAHATAYFDLRIWSAPAALLNYAVLGLLIGLQRTRAALCIQLLLNLSNVALDVLLVLQLDMGITGVAVATLIAEYTAAVVGLWLSHRILSRMRARPRARDVFDARRLAATASVNANIFIRTAVSIFAFFSFTSIGAGFGNITLAANSVLLHFAQVMAYGLDGFAHAAEALAGAAYGRRDRHALSAAMATTTVWALVVAVIYSLVYWLAGEHIIAGFTTIEPVREEARRFLPWVIAAPLVGVWSYQLDGIFIGTTHTREMRNGMLISFAVFMLAVQVLLAPFGNHGLWAALLLFLAARAITLGLWLPRIRRSLVTRAGSSPGN